MCVCTNIVYDGCTLNEKGGGRIFYTYSTKSGDIRIERDAFSVELLFDLIIC